MSVRRMCLALILPVLTALLATTSARAEAGIAEPVTMKAFFGAFSSSGPTTEITRPDDVRVNASLRDADQLGVPDVPVELWARPYGADWRKLSTVTTSSAGAVNRTVAPAVNTRYQWRFAGDATHQPAQSVVLLCQVHVMVTLRIADSTVRLGDRVVATGVVRPAKPGRTATLWHRAPTGTSVVARTTIRSDGSFRFATRMSRGTKSVLVTVPAASGNLGGTSPIRTVKVG